MAKKQSKKQYDLVIMGATGFTGKWVAKHLFDHYSNGDLNWAIAGRNSDKMNDVRDFIGDSSASIDGVLADSSDEASLLELVQSTKVIISTVGPYALHGSLLVRLCAEAGTHYVDLCGETPWMREMIDAHQVAAEKSGAKIVHSCGFDSVPSDMGVFFTQQQAQKTFSKPLRSVCYQLIKAKGGISGGTIASMMNIVKLAVKDKSIRKLLANPYALNPDPSFKGPDKGDQMSAKFSKVLDKWTAPFVMAGVNTRIVRRSNALLDFSYGEDFRYSEVMVTSKGAGGYLSAKAISGGVKTIVVTSVTEVGRKFLGIFLPAQGEGPKVDPENPGFYHIQFNGETESGESLVTKLLGDGDPGYGSTSKMLAESGVCLALDSLTTGGGFWTPASALGDAYLKRLQDKGGLSFAIVS
ncbi:MAG: short subunit dehydrogenase-like uncharacterized protein [Arenicella sp.]|jgi:short subunit dehydrogenase-like uncharacterized protein